MCVCVCMWCICVLCVHAPARNTSSALLLLGPGDMELQQPPLSWADGSHMIYFPQQISLLFIYTYIPNQKVLFGLT